ncbi:GNAT family N-acetyltransferase [Streptomyces sp. NPDC057445]|uniref:GNAT family N-acetyltransferase n=1 Tax=Streptomyces sp. NPDC057445 TaxID=3346136 RepID=UPI0036C729A0
MPPRHALRPFTVGDIETAAALLAARCPGLAGPADLLRRAWEDGARGAITENGYLLARPGDGERGRHVWTAAECSAGEPDALRRLYTHLAAGWLADGRGHHYVLAPVADVPVWQSLCFAYEQVHGVRELKAPEAGADGTATAGPGQGAAGAGGFRIRAAGPDDLDRLAPLFPLVAEAHTASPVFAYIESDFHGNLRPGHLEALEDPSIAYWMAEDPGGEALGIVLMRTIPEAEASCLTPAGSIELLIGATAVRVRGTGVGRALTEHALADAARRGFRACVTDWRAANPESSVFWPNRGFRPVAHRMHRILDPRLLSPSA